VPISREVRRRVPRCAGESCFGNIILADGVHDHALVCNECGFVLRSSLASKGAEWRSFQKEEGCRVGEEASSRFAQEGVGESALHATVMRAALVLVVQPLVQPGRVCGRRAGWAVEHAGARLELRLADQQRTAEEDISRLCDALDLNEMVKQDAADFFAETAEIQTQRFKDGGQINTYIATVLASIHCASLVAHKRF